jgi:hypothetical protein
LNAPAAGLAAVALLMTSGLTNLLACVAALARSLEGAFDPRRFDEGRTFSAFARHVVGAGPLLEFSNYTIAFDPSGRFPRHAWATPRSSTANPS